MDAMMRQILRDACHEWITDEQLEALWGNIKTELARRRQLREADRPESGK